MACSPRFKRRLAIPATLVVTMLGGSAALIASCGEDDSARRTGVDAAVVDGSTYDGGIDAPDQISDALLADSEVPIDAPLVVDAPMPIDAPIDAPPDAPVV